MLLNMTGKNPKIDAYLDTPGNWRNEMRALRAILVDCALTEELKWGKPCYTHDGSNVVILFALKDYCGLGFFKGALLRDDQGILHRQGKNSQAVRLIRVTSVAEIVNMQDTLKAYIQQAIDVEKAGLKIDFKEKHELVFPEELQSRLNADPALKAAFTALTPGRQRAYNLYFSAPKQSKTRALRIAKHVDRILAGKGMNDR